MAEKKPLTTQYLGTRFSNPFRLINHAIELAHNKIASGCDTHVENSSIRNLAYQVLEEIAQDKDYEKRKNSHTEAAIDKVHIEGDYDRKAKDRSAFYKS